MPGQFDSARVRRLYGSAQFFRRDVHICLERSCALGDPKLHHAPRVFGILELMHLQRERSGAFEIGSRHMNFRPCHFAVIDGAFQFEIGVWVDASGRSNRRHAPRQIQPREAPGMLRVKRRRPTRRGIKHVLVHPDKAGNHRAPGEIQHFRALGDFYASRIAERGNLSVPNDKSLIRARSGAGAVNDAHVRQGNHRGIFLHERAHFRSELGPCLGPATRGPQGSPHQHAQSREHHFSHEPLRGGRFFERGAVYAPKSGKARTIHVNHSVRKASFVLSLSSTELK